MKKILFGAAAALIMASCTPSPKGQANTSDNSTEAQPTTGLRIAYVQLDTLMSQYQLYRDYSEELTRKGTNIQSTLAQKQRTLEKHASDMQKKYERNEFTTRDELERAQNGIQKEQAELQQLAERLNNEFNIEQMRVNEEARDSIQAFLKVYNKEKKYDYVLVKAGDNLLIANPQLDITEEVVRGLNQAYKGAAKTDSGNGLKKMGDK